MDPKLLQEKQTTTASKIGLDLDFYCKFSIKKVAEKFSTLLKSQVEIITDEEFTPTTGKFYIREGYGYGKERYSFICSPLPYTYSRQILIKVFSLIKEYCYTDKTCVAKIDYSYDKNLIPISITRLNILKFILEFNEDMVWRFFPEQKDSIYVKSIKNILPQNKFYRSENLNISDFNYILPNMKFFGANFERVKDGFVQFRYIGGKDYEYKTAEALDLITIYNSFLSRCLYDPSYTEKNKRDLKKIISGADKILKAYDSYESFVKEYPDIHLTVDMEDNIQIIKSKFSSFRDSIFDLLAGSNLSKGDINYDSAMSRIQIRNAELHIYSISQWEFIDCVLVLEEAEKCSFFGCKIENSKLDTCNLYRYSQIKTSRLEDTYINRTCEINDSYIYGALSTIEGRINKGIIVSGRVGTNAIISKETEIIDYEKIYVK